MGAQMTVIARVDEAIGCPRQDASVVRTSDRSRILVTSGTGFAGGQDGLRLGARRCR
jgi:hypothetical protein